MGKEICVPGECSPKSELSRRFDNQVARMTSSMDTSDSFSPATPIITYWVDEQRWQEFMAYGLPLTNANLTMVTA